MLCTSSQAAALQAGYAGTTYSGKYKTPSFPFCDKDGNSGSGANLLPQLNFAMTGGSGSGMSVNLNYCQASDVSAAKPCKAAGLVKSASGCAITGVAWPSSSRVKSSSLSGSRPILL